MTTKEALEQLSGLANLYSDSRMGPTISEILVTLRAEVDSLKTEVNQARDDLFSQAEANCEQENEIARLKDELVALRIAYRLLYNAATQTATQDK